MIEILKQGGVVMIPLIFGSVVTVAVILERFFTLVQCERGGAKFRAGLAEAVRTRTVPSTGTGPVTAVTKAAIDNWDKPTPVLETAMAGAARRQVPMLERNMSVLESAVTAAPLVGLLGTITGMMGVFRVVAQRLAHDPSADTSHITAGIGEALVATAFGILIAVFAIIAYNAYRSWADGLMDESELVAADLLQMRA